jgi:hypothetical protein
MKTAIILGIGVLFTAIIMRHANQTVDLAPVLHHQGSFKPVKLALIGATGAVGKEIVRHA